MQCFPQIGTRIGERPSLVDRVLRLPLLGGVTGGVVEDDVIEGLDADGEVVFVVQSLERGEQRIVDLGEVAERRAGGTEGGDSAGTLSRWLLLSRWWSPPPGEPEA